MGNSHGNLGLLYGKRGDVEKARQLWAKARELFRRIGMPHMVEKMQRWIKGIDD